MKNLTFKAAALNDGRPTVNRRSTDGQSQRRYSLTLITKRWRALMMVVFLFTFAVGNVWAESVTFTATDMSGKTSGVKNESHITALCPTSESDQQAYKTGSAVKHKAISLGSSADTAVIVPASGKSLHFRADAGYKITGISIFAAANKDSICGEPIVMWTGTISKKPAYVGNIEAPARNGSSDPAPIVVAGIPEGTTAFALYRRIKYNSSTGEIGSGSNFGRSQQTWNIFSVTITYEATGSDPVCPETLTISSKDSKTAFDEGDAIELTAALAKGNGDISYQWYKGSVAPANAISGATNAKYEVASCTTADAGDYFCVASKDDCSDAVNASAFAIMVAAAPVIEPTGTATISYALSGSTTTGTVTGVNSISSLSSSLTLSTLTLSGTKDGYSGAIKGCTSTTELVEADYVDVQFTVGSGYVFTPSAVTVQVNPFTATGAVKAVVKVMDAQPLVVVSEVLSCAKSTDNEVTFASGAFTNKKFEGTVHLRMYFYGAASNKTFYLKSPISITGTVAVAPTKYNVTFDKNDEGAGGSQTTLKYESGAEVTLPACTFVAPTGKEFDAWTSTDVTISDGKFTMPSNAVTIKATWKTSSTKYTVTYKEGETTLDTEEVTAGTAPTGYSALESKNLASFVAWYNNADLAEEHKIADMSAETVSEATTYYGKWTYNYASSVNIEQWTLTNGAGKGATTKTSALIAQLGTNKFASNLSWVNGDLELDSLSTKSGRNEPYLGLKVKVGGKMLDFRLAKDSYVKVKFGEIKSTLPQVSINGGEYENMVITEKVWSYTATGNDYISIKTADANAVVFKQIMINEDIAAVTLPWRVTYDANGGTCATAEAIWSGSALILPAVTAPTDYTFAGWYDEATGGVLVGAAGASYTPTDNTTLFAHFAPVEYAINYNEGDHGQTAIVAASAGWGTEYTAIANPFTPESGYIFAGWAVTGVDGVSTLADGGSFTMPKNEVTLTALWEDNSKVAVVVETNVKYESLAEAIAAAEAGQTIQLLQNIEQENGVAIAKNLTLDLNGKTYTCTSGSNVNSRAIKITAGTVTIQNGSIVAVPTANFEGGCYGPIRIEGASTNVTLEDLTLQNGRHYGLGIKLVEGYLRMEDCTVISENGGGGLEVGEATADVINCTFTQTGLDNAHAWISTCLATCDNGVLNVQGGTYTSEHYSMYVYTSGGEMNVESGSFTGDVVNKVTLSSYPDAVGTVNISGGSFEGAGGNPIQFTTDNSGATSIAISGGTFDAPVENEYCAPGYVPSDADPVTGKYTVEPKDGVEIIGVVVTGNTTGDVSGLYKGTAAVNLNSKKLDSGKYIYVTLKEGYTFEENDVLIVDVNAKSNIGTSALEITTGVGNIDGAVWKTLASDEYSTGDNSITLEGIAAGQTSIGLKRSDNQNAKINGLRVLRPMKPMLTAITIDGRDGVIDEANKTVAVKIPYEADLAALTVVPTIVWNEAAASNSIVVNDGSAWIEGANTYKLTDKDGDYTVYTITLTRDVQKHAVKFYDGETLLETLEVEDGTSIAAGDVPADPEKEDYLFQGWAETVDGAAVDVTSFTISAAKNFYAKWAADGAIKLINKTSGAVNEDGYFITGVTATEANSEKAAAWGGTQGTSISGVNALGKIVQYNATTNQTKIKIKVYNTNSSDKYVYIHKIIEGKTTEESVETLTATSKTVVESEYYEFNDTKNRSFYLTTNSTDVKILQVKVIDDGATPMKQAGEAGYSLNLNKGRVVYYGNSDVTFEGLALNSASNYSVINSSEFQTTKNISFSISSPVLLKVTTNTAKYYVSQNPDEDGTTATEITAAGTAEFELTETTNPWYLVPSTTSNVKYTNIAFELPKAATPVIETQPATDHTFAPGDMTATVVATVTEGTLHYQWYKKATVGDDEEVGTDAATLTTTTEGTYYVVVTNTFAGHQDVSVTSEEAELGYRVTNDATLMALSYCGTAITLEDGVYTYAVELAKGTTDVPALAATATMNGYATVTISNAAEFVNYEASSTVTVKSEDLTETNVYTVNFYVKHDLPQVDVTATTTWDMTNVSANAINLKDDYNPSKQNVRLLLANIEGVNNNASFNSQALMFEGQHIGRTSNNVKHLAGQYVQFNVTVPGMVSVTFASNGSAQRTIQINGKVCSRTTNDGAYITYNVAVEPGSVEIEDVQGYVRISKIEFKAEYSHNRPGLNPANIGTLCWTNNAILGGATLYELIGKNENNKLVFDEVAENRLEAGKPYIFVPENGNTEIKLYNTDTEAALTSPIQNESGMQGTFVDLSSANGDLWGYYVISKNHYIYVDSDNVTLKKYRAYVLGLDDLNIVSNGPAPINGAPRRRIVMGAQGEQVATGIDNLEASEKPLKLMIDGQMYILRGEKLFDATGRLVK